MTNLLSIRSLAKHYDGIAAVKDATFDVATKDIVAITGENGAGKTTLFNLLTGLQKPDHGSALFKGEELVSQTPLHTARSGIARLYQHPRIFKNLPVLDNVVAAAVENPGVFMFRLIAHPVRSRRFDDQLKDDALRLLRQFALDEFADKTSSDLSFGEQKLVSFCMLAFRKPALALLDEPFSGLNPKMIEKICKIIRRMRDEGVTFLLIEHNISKALAIADRQIEMTAGVTREVYR